MIIRENLSQAQEYKPYGFGDEKQVFIIPDNLSNKEKIEIVIKDFFANLLERLDFKKKTGHDYLICVNQIDFYNLPEHAHLHAKSIYYYSKLGQELGLSFPSIVFSGYVDKAIVFIVEKVNNRKKVNERSVRQIAQKMNKVGFFCDDCVENFVNNGKKVFFVDYPIYVFSRLNFERIAAAIDMLPEENKIKAKNYVAKLIQYKKELGLA